MAGLAGGGLVLRNNGGDDLTVAASATSFTFTTPVASGAAFAVTVQTQPTSPSQTCTVMGGTGNVGAAGVTSVAINCTTNSFSVGGTISGLAGSVILQNNGGDDRIVTSNGSFAFATPVTSGGAYAITVLTQPGTPSQTCTVAQGSGTVGAAAVASPAITCVTNTFPVRAAVTGLAAVGLSLANGSDTAPVSTDGTVTISAAVASGASYAVSVAAQPTDQTCTPGAGASGMVGGAAVTVPITCVTNQYKVRGTVAGVAGTIGLHNGSDDITSGNGAFEFPTKVTAGGSYAVSVTTALSGCTITNGSGTVSGGDAVVTIACSSPMVYHFPFDGNANDTSGNGNNGVVNNATLVADRHGTANSAYSFNGTTAWIEAPGGALPVGGAARSLTFWMKPSDAHGQWGIVYWGNNDCTGLMWGFAFQGNSGFWGGCNDYISNVAIPVGSWSFAALVFTPPNTVRVRVGSTAMNGTIGTVSTTASKLWIGAETITNDSNNFRGHYAGDLDDIRIFNRALTEAELDGIMALP